MHRLAIAVLMSLVLFPLSAGELAHKQTYSAEAFRGQGAATVASLLARYARDTGLERVSHAAPLLLVNGMQADADAVAMDRALADASSVEVMSDGDAVVVNVLK